MKYKIIYIPFDVNGKRIDGIKGAVCELDPERPEEYTILINTNYPEEVQCETLKHELKHLELNHYKRIKAGDITLAEAETEAHSSNKKRATDRCEQSMTQYKTSHYCY